MTTSSATPFSVVVIGASAGGLEAFLRFIANIEADSGRAYVFVQHLDPTHPSIAAEIIAKETPLRVIEVTEGMMLAPDMLYLQPSNSSLDLIDGRFRLHPRTGEDTHLSIDQFFTSLAAGLGPRLTGIVLSGNGTDGTKGLNQIKEHGGITYVQAPESAKNDAMPRSAIDGGEADFVMAPEEMAIHLRSQKFTGDLESTCEDFEAEHLTQVFQLLHQATAVDFNLYKPATVTRRLRRRMAILRLPTISLYRDYLAHTPEEAKKLYDEILIHVTEFFRDPQSYESIRSIVLPKLIKKSAPPSPLRIWVAGCSTGEEVYSIAMLVSEYLEDIRTSVPLQIFATDISEQAIAVARLGLYPTSIEQQVPAPLLTKYFRSSTDGYKVNKSLRDLCLFSKHDMITDPPFASIDLISCRNVLIYFSAELQKKVIPTFHYALKASGVLWLGKSETCGGFTNLFELQSKTHKYYVKKPTTSQIRFSFPAKGPHRQAASAQPKDHVQGRSHQDYFTAADKIVLAKFSPPSVIVNADLDIIQFRGRSVPFLEPSAGTPSSNLLRMARPELQAGLRLLVKAVKKDNKPLRRENFSVDVDGDRRSLSISIMPLNPEATAPERLFLVVFLAVDQLNLSADAPSADGPRQRSKDIATSQEISNLVNELSEAKESQQLLIEEYDLSQEELTSANEELQSSNEELQSTNEELETAKEELQSTNEELTTVNEELELRNLDLTTLGSDLSNLLSSTEIPILMIGSDRRIRRFTTEAKDAFNLITSDIGRPIGDIKSNYKLDLEKLIDEVTLDHQPRKIEVQDRLGAWRHLQIRPYRTVDNKIDGVSIALLDIDQLKQKEHNFKQSLDYIKSVADSVPLPFAVIGHDNVLKTANRSFYNYFNIATNANGRDFFELLAIPESYRSSLKLLIQKNIRTNTPFGDFELTFKVPGSGTRKMLLSGGKVHWVGDEPEAVLISFIDITERSRLEGELTRLLALEREARGDAEKANRTKDVFLATLSHELRTPLSAILTWSQLIGTDRIDEATKRHGAAVIEQSAKTQSQLIDDLLDISRIISGKLSLKIKDVDPAEVIRSAIESVLSLSAQKNIQIEAILSPERGLILADPVRLQQIVWNLLTNSIKFSPRDSRIEVSLEYHVDSFRRTALVRVVDHGKGIPKDFLPNIFDRFSQADSASTRLHGGLGLGLSIVRNLVELQGGTVTAENGKRGTGAILSLKFPVIPTKGEILSAQLRPNDLEDEGQHDVVMPCLNGLNILFVDDNDNTRDALIIYLRSYGATVRSANSAKSALKLFLKERPDVLVSDIAMPTEDGYSLIKKIRRMAREKGSHVPAIALTAYANVEDSDIAKSAGFNAHVAKPVDAATLAHEIIRSLKESIRKEAPLIGIMDQKKK